MAAFEILVVLSHGLYIHTDLLGKQYNVIVNNCAGILYLPKLGNSTASAGPLLPPDAVPNLSDIPQGERLEIGEINLLSWGSKDSEPDTYKVNSIFLSFPFDEHDDIEWRQAEWKVVNGILPWLNTLKAAVEVQTGTYETYGLWPYGTRFSYWYRKGSTFTKDKLRTRFRTRGPIQFCSEAIFSTAINAVSNKKILAPASAFLQAAHIFFNNSLLREAVINAAAAVEVIFASELRKRGTLKNKMTLGSQKKEIDKLNILPTGTADFESGLLNLRNDIIHNGKYCSQDEAKGALVIARAIITHLEPSPFV